MNAELVRIVDGLSRDKNIPQAVARAAKNFLTKRLR